MDEETTRNVLSKVETMGLVIAYPDVLVTPGYVEDQFKGVSTTRITVHSLHYVRNT
jgi:hypothetical protein